MSIADVLRYGLHVGLDGGLNAVLVYGPRGGLRDGLDDGLFYGLDNGLFYGLNHTIRIALLTKLGNRS